MKFLRVLAVALVLSVFSSVTYAQTEMEFWFAGTTAQVAYMQAAVDEYNAAQSAIKINLVNTPESRERIATAIAGGQGPDLMWYNHNMPWFFGIEAVYPLNDFITDPEIGIDPAQVFPASRGTVHYGGVVQAVPMRHSPGGVLINLDLFEEAGLSFADAPKTWEEVEALAIKLTKRDGDTVTQWGIVNGAVDWMLQEVNLSNGSDWVADDLSTYVTHPDRLVEGLEWWSSLLLEHKVLPYPSGVTWAGVEALQVGSEAFVRGEAAMSGFHCLCSAAGFIDQNPDLNLAGVITPLGPSSNGQRIVSLGFDGIFVMADAADPREGYLFAKWFFEEKSLGLVQLSPGTVPSATAALDDEYFQNDPVLGYGSVLEAMETAELRTFHVFPGRLDVRSQEPAMAESVMLERATPQQAVDTFLRHAAQVFDLYRPELDEFLEMHVMVW
jgi:ABC-type glycerol-3-phosphate transport system substrate-binding protein